MTAQGRSKGAFIGIGAGLTLIILLVLQSLTGSGLLSTRVVTTTTTAAVSTVPDAYQQVASGYANHLLLLDSRNMTALAGGYDRNATIEWTGVAAGLTGSYVGLADIRILLTSFVGKFNDLSLSNESQTIGGRGDYWVVNSSFNLYGHSSIIGNFNGTVVAQDSYVHTGNSWSIAHETWNFTKYNVQYRFT